MAMSPAPQVPTPVATLSNPFAEVCLSLIPFIKSTWLTEGSECSLFMELVSKDEFIPTQEVQHH